jgi:hypothetical protein
VADFDITTLILSEHEAFRRAFTQIEQLTDPEELGSRWRSLADQLEVHAAGEETVFYPELLRDVDDSEGETEHAVKDHNEIREATQAVDAHPVGSDAWWDAFRRRGRRPSTTWPRRRPTSCRRSRRRSAPSSGNELGMRWLQFLEEHEGAEG